jgi:hypothetical protein
MGQYWVQHEDLAAVHSGHPPDSADQTDRKFPKESWVTSSERGTKPRRARVVGRLAHPGAPYRGAFTRPAAGVL